MIMKLVKNLPTRINDKTGRIESWGLFWCDFCKQEVEKRLHNGYKNKSCGCIRIQLISESSKGRKYTKDRNKKISESLKGRSCPEEIKQKIRETIIKNGSSKGKNNPMYNVHRFGENSPNWNDGSSFEPYSTEFNKELKDFIKQRDNYTCQDPNCDGNYKKLHIHHIDYDKKNNSPENLITLCDSCHTKTNGKYNREYYLKFYQNILMGKLLGCLL